VGSSVICYASIVDHPDGTFFLSCLSNVRVISRGTCWSLVVTWGALIVIMFLSAIPCEVTGLSAKETCEDFPLSILLDGSTRVSSFSAPPYTLFVSISSWEEVFRFRNSCPRSSWGRVHRVRVSWCIILPWFIGWWGTWSRFESVRSVLHVCIELLLLYCSVPPVFVVLRFWSPHDVGIHGIR
jgi:hypothetical protein